MPWSNDLVCEIVNCIAILPICLQVIQQSASPVTSNGVIKAPRHHQSSLAKSTAPHQPSPLATVVQSTLTLASDGQGQVPEQKSVSTPTGSSKSLPPTATATSASLLKTCLQVPRKLLGYEYKFLLAGFDLYFPYFPLRLSNYALLVEKPAILLEDHVSSPSASQWKAACKCDLSVFCVTRLCT